MTVPKGRQTGETRARRPLPALHEEAGETVPLATDETHEARLEIYEWSENEDGDVVARLKHPAPPNLEEGQSDESEEAG